jgi:tetraacyldisaccharide 4'-kinase
MKRLQAPRFWWRKHGLAGYALAPLGALYGGISGRRMARPAAAAGVPVICVGNLVIGGAGKTPTAIEVSRVCRKLSLNPGFLSRGYRGRETGPIVVSTAVHTATDVGDEALLLAQHAPTVVAADRPSGARLLASLGADVVVMDDAAWGIGNGFVFPAGPLRAPLSVQIRHADALVVLGPGPGSDGVRLAARAGLPILRAHTEAVRRRGLRRRPYLAFTGIAEPQKFYAALGAAGATIARTMSFPDHHLFTDAECEAILAAAKERDLVPITTEKDHVRLAKGGSAAERLAAATETFPVRVRFEEPRRLVALINDAVALHGSAYRQKNLTLDGAAPVPA